MRTDNNFWMPSECSLSQGQNREVKYTLVEIADELEKTRSRRDYNRYEMGYESVFSMGHTLINSVMFVETSFTVVSFPTVIMPVVNYV